jgi:hypothetical protein
MPLLNSMIVAHSDPDNISLSFSANFVAVNLFGALATTGTSMLIEANGTGIIFPLAIVATIPTIALILLLRKLEGARARTGVTNQNNISGNLLDLNTKRGR